MVSIYTNFDKYYEVYKLTKPQKDFFEWCRAKFNVEEFGKGSINNYSKFVEVLNLPDCNNYKPGKEKQLAMLKTFCDLQVEGRKYSINELYHSEQQECVKVNLSTYGVYKVAFELLFSDWWNSRNVKDYFASTEEIAIAMGLLRFSYCDLEAMYKNDKLHFNLKKDKNVNEEINICNLNSIQKLDWEKRMEDLIITQLKMLMIDKKNNKNYNISETFVRKNHKTKIVDGIETRVIEYKGELSNEERVEIYARIDAIKAEEKIDDTSIHVARTNRTIQVYYTQLREKGIYPSWKILATPRKTFADLPEDFKDFLGKVLIDNKQDKVHRASTLSEGKRNLQIDTDESCAFDFREDLYIVENILDGRSLYKEFENADGTIDYVRLVSGAKIQEARTAILTKTEIAEDGWD